MVMSELASDAFPEPCQIKLKSRLTLLAKWLVARFLSRDLVDRSRVSEATDVVAIRVNIPFAAVKKIVWFVNLRTFLRLAVEALQNQSWGPQTSL